MPSLKIEDKKTGNASVTQDNALVSASYRLTLDAKRLLLLAISKLDSKKDYWREGEHTVRVEATDWLSYYKTSPNLVYQQMRGGMDALFDAQVIVREDEDRGKAFRWISKKEYYFGEGWLEVTFTRDVLIYLNSLFSTFTTYKLLNIGGLRSIHSIRIYELISQFRATGWRKISIEELRAALGIEADQYPKFPDFRKRVLNVAVKEINKKTDLHLTLELGKRGRKFTNITFRFFAKEEQTPPPQEVQEEAKEVEEVEERLSIIDTMDIPRFLDPRR